MPEKDINWNLLVRYISGSMTSDEAQRVSEWIDADPENEKFLLYLRKIWDNSVADKERWDLDATWERFKDHYDFPSAGQEISGDTLAEDLFTTTESPTEEATEAYRPIIYRRIRGRYGYGWAAVAAAAIIVVLVASYLFPQIYSVQTEPDNLLVEMREVVTKYGQRTHLNLSDGSRVILNAGSKLVLPEYFRDGAPREIYLSGEAYFEVANDTTRPFYVYTDEAITRVVGTKFEVRSYADAHPLQVVVSEGEVELQDREQNLQASSITRNRKGVLTEEGTVEVTDVEDVSTYLGWTEGKLIFDREPLQYAIPRLERWYDIRIETDRLATELLSRELSAEFTEYQPLEEVLEAIAIALDIDFTKMDGNSRFEFLNLND